MNVYLEIEEKDRNKVIEFMSKNDITLLSEFYSPLDKAFEQNIEYYLDNTGNGFITNSIEEKILLLNEEDKLKLINESVSLLTDNEYLVQTFNESTIEAIEQSLDYLFIKSEKIEKEI